ncbi:MAG: DUF4870 domain-containing protein [Ignavibacteriae bacterium]|nr:DUF4870 domain-containing protein [Ignavibacteriota bacterium]
MAESTRNLNITPEEIESGKTMAFVAYLIFFIPLLMDEYKKNKFVMYHTEQSIVLAIFWVIWVIVVSIFVTIISFITMGFGLILSILYFVPFVFLIIGIINAFNGKIVQLPIVGQFGEKFNLVK